MPELEIDGKPIEVPDGSTVMEAAHRLGIFVPHFCYHRKLSIAANCRMCLVQVEKAPKPLPACATPVTAGMKVWTHSAPAVTAQKGVMEFLLINHPLDCPICDQGGECQLQDLAVGYGGSASRYAEEKRVVANKDLGPLISTDMTRCIHCTRCVRFGQEIAGIMELGMIGRGEHSEIITFVGRTVDSEVSGNAIDLCPVGALTSKPFRYSARTWELVRRPSISPHCGLGSNITVQVKQNRVMRVLPRENEAINECWLSDKDRFAYEGLNSSDRLARPMVRRDGRLEEVDWSVALDAAVAGLRRVRDAHGAASIGALASPHSTLEELCLLGKLVRGLGCENVDFRLRQRDFRLDGRRAGVPWLGMSIAELSRIDRVLIVGSTLRKDHPLVAVRLRQAARKGLQVNVIHSVDDDLLMPVVARSIVPPSLLPSELAGVVKACAEQRGKPFPDLVASASVSESARRIAESLATGSSCAILLGNFAEHHGDASMLHALAKLLADTAGARFGFLGEAANSVGGYLAGAVPGKDGLNALSMIEQPRKAYVLLGAEVEFDCAEGARALTAMHDAEFVIALSPYQHAAVKYADVLLPIATFTETSGTFISTEGRVQSFTAVVKPLAEARPAWKVIRVIGNLLSLEDFGYESTEAIRSEVVAGDVEARLSNEIDTGAIAPVSAAVSTQVERIAEVPIYRADPIVRRAVSLASTRDGTSRVAGLSASMMSRLGLSEGECVTVSQRGGGAATLVTAVDDAVPDGCVRIATACSESLELGGAHGALTIERSIVVERKAG